MTINAILQVTFSIMGYKMYKKEYTNQMVIEDFFTPFGGKISADNRWVRLSELMPWEQIEKLYTESFESGRGRGALSSRIAFGAIFVKQS